MPVVLFKVSFKIVQSSQAEDITKTLYVGQISVGCHAQEDPEDACSSVEDIDTF